MWIFVSRGCNMTQPHVEELDNRVSTAVLAITVASWGGQLWPENTVFKMVNVEKKFDMSSNLIQADAPQCGRSAIIKNRTRKYDDPTIA